MALSLNSVTPTGHINNIIYWCAGIFNIRGLTFGHDLDNRVVGTSWHRAMLILGKTLLEVAKAKAVSECQT
jgi:hypothetical protein